MKPAYSHTVYEASQVDLTLRWVEGLIRRALPGGPVLVALGRPKRSEDQSARFHAMCGDCAQQLTFMNRKLSKDQWKILFVSGHAMATGTGADVVPGLEGEFCNLRESTAGMTKARMSSLIEYVAAYGAEQGVKFSEPEAA